MKKQLLNLGMVVGALAIYIGTAVAAPIQPYRSMEVPYCLDCEADGTIEDSYSAEQTTDWMYPNQQPAYGGASDFTAVFRVAYTTTHLWIIATITDDVAENYDWTYSSEWMFDNIEWFVQLDTNTSATAYDAGTEQMRICRGLDSVQGNGQVPRSAYVDTYYMEDPTGTGWLTEVGMPWEAVYTDGVLPEDILTYMEDGMGFDFSGADSDDTDGDPTVGNRDYQTGWDLDGQDGTEDLAWNNVTTFGFITFGEIPDAIQTNANNTVKSYPNPATTTITFDVDAMAEIDILGVTGNLIKSVRGNVVDVSDLPSGIYFASSKEGIARFAVK